MRTGLVFYSDKIIWWGDGMREPEQIMTTPISSHEYYQNPEKIISELEEALASNANDDTFQDMFSRIGRRLYQMLGIGVTNDVDKRLKDLYNSDQRIDYVFRFAPDSARWASLPWELLRVDNTLLLRSSDSLERQFTHLDGNYETLNRFETVRILSWLPQYLNEIRLRFNNLLNNLSSNHKLDTEFKFLVNSLGEDSVTVRRVFEQLDRNPRPQIIHFVGHGSSDGLSFDDGWLKGRDKLLNLFGDASLVVLCACRSATIPFEKYNFSSIAQILLGRCSAVVAMQFPVSAEYCELFSQILYNQLLIKRKSLQEAVAIARIELSYTDYGNLATPVLYTQGDNSLPFYLWASEDQSEPKPVITDRLQTGDRLYANPIGNNIFQIFSPNKKYELHLQKDNNLVLYLIPNHGEKESLWDSKSDPSKYTPEGEHEPIAYGKMQRDGNFVLYTDSDAPIWATDTPENPFAYLRIIDEGKIVLYSADGTTRLWERP